MTVAVYFDLDGTLLTYEEPFRQQFDGTVAPYGKPTTIAYDAYLESLFGALDACEPEPYRRAFEAVTATIDVDATAATLAREHCERELEASVVSERTKQVVEGVTAANPTGVLTNGASDQQRAKLEHHGVDGLVDEVIVSNDVGLRKPDPELFDLARTRLEADEYVYVGDSYEEDIVGASDLDFWTIYVADDPTETDAADAVVSSVGDLADPVSLPPLLESTFGGR